VKRVFVAIVFAAVFALAVVAFAACTQRPRMCVAAGECGTSAACVAGRCLPDGGVPAIQAARRLLVDPVDVSYLRRGDGANGGALPAIITLGRAADSEAMVLVRFSVPIAKDANVIEAYLLLERTDLVDSDPTPIVLHASRIIDPWDGRSISWARQPRIHDTRSPSTIVTPWGRTQVRVDVRDLVAHWRLHQRDDQGLAIIAENSSATGIALALTAAEEASPLGSSESTSANQSSAGGSSGGLFEPRSPATLGVGPSALPSRAGPRLELYVK
jgi:hypothetical protein